MKILANVSLVNVLYFCMKQQYLVVNTYNCTTRLCIQGLATYICANGRQL